MKIAIITNCSSRKSVRPASGLLARSLRCGTAADVAKEWSVRVRAAKQWVSAKRLYQGRAFCEALLAAEITGYPLHVISAGLGFICETDLIPPYNLTASDGHPDSIPAKIYEAEMEKWRQPKNAAAISPRCLGDWMRCKLNTLVILA